MLAYPEGSNFTGEIVAMAKPDATAPTYSAEKPSACPTPNLGEDPTCRTAGATHWGAWQNIPAGACP